MGHIFFGQSVKEVAQFDQVAIAILALRVFVEQLAVGDNDALGAVLELVAVQFQKGYLGCVDPFCLFQSQTFIPCAGQLLTEAGPGCGLFVQHLQVFGRGSGRDRPLDQLMEFV